MRRGTSGASVPRPRLLESYVALAVTLMGSPTLSGCAVEAPATDAWGPVVELRDDTDMWPEGKPKGGWWVTPIHATLLPSGNVLITGWSRRDSIGCTSGGTRRYGITFVLDPSDLTGNVLNVVPLDEQGYSANDVLYCAGHVPMADGRVLYSGGSRYENLGKPTEIESGINYARLYDATENRLIRIDAPMTGGPTGEEGVRWYPTNTRLADSRVLVTGGFTRCCGFDFANLSLELFDYLAYKNGAPPWQVLVSHDEGLSDVAPGPVDYTHVYLLPNAVPAARGDHFDRQVAMIGGSGNVLLFNYADDLSARERFAEPPNGRRGARADGATGALLATGEIMLLGGTDDPTTAQRADFYDPHKDVWSSVDTHIGRFHPASVLLPDGTVLIVNGGSKPGFAGDSRQPQTIDPVTLAVTTWAAWPDDPRARGYHNIALLLKDGRVLVGGGIDPGDSRIWCERPDVRIYAPAYLSKGPRPTLLIGSEPIRMTVGGRAASLSYANGPIRSSNGVLLMALGSMTHAFDQNQRYVALDFEASGTDTLLVTPPANYFVAPPGDYILFLVNDSGVPSEGIHVRLD